MLGMHPYDKLSVKRESIVNECEISVSAILTIVNLYVRTVK